MTESNQVIVRERPTKVPHDVVEQLRAAVREGARHECEEWIGEGSSTCVLCGRVYLGDPVRRLRELTPDEARAALEQVFNDKADELKRRRR